MASSRAVADGVSERTALLGRQLVPENDIPNSDDLTRAQPVAGGTVLGIHNLAIVFPQFIVRLLCVVPTLWVTHLFVDRVGRKCDLQGRRRGARCGRGAREHLSGQEWRCVGPAVWGAKRICTTFKFNVRTVADHFLIARLVQFSHE
jgi:hypothetical protein